MNDHQAEADPDGRDGPDSAASILAGPHRRWVERNGRAAPIDPRLVAESRAYARPVSAIA